MDQKSQKSTNMKGSLKKILLKELKSDGESG